ncbi:PREDICTED: protein unc-93 homolog A-like isoform X2 [Amphimedon queenslandica]|uniref:Uncharacterized protein n=1 Tax=Amphimedon queenslandica TaxID=400682 RepID=A0AAN0JIT9_AMPQE|nr:PREDICTED: protein unc-93 homolog A-like isoform X2 [Amphimedon queenslandica]|eukprot:XP_019856884.1 PREDICTED: protein unc-93 homolog A-like isoform X2 [Amphimedon queenslandica]
METLSPLELKDFVEERKPSLLEKEKRTLQCCSTSPKSIAYKNLLGVSISYWIIFGAYLAVIGLQSSLNEEIGLASLSILYATFLLSGLYTSAVLQIFGTKITLVACYIVMLLYTLSNYYPNWYTLITGSVLFGLAFGPIWASLSIHVATVARQYASSINKNPAHFISLFIGINTMFYKLGYVPANIASSAILLLRSSRSDDGYTDNSTNGICNNTDASDISDESLYIILSVDVFFDLLAILILIVFVDHLGATARLDSVGKTLSLYVKKPFLATLKMFTEWKMLLVLPMMTFDGFVISFALGSFARFYVSDCIGVQWVGLTQMAFGVFSALSAVINGRLVKIVPQTHCVFLILGESAQFTGSFSGNDCMGNV